MSTITLAANAIGPSAYYSGGTQPGDPLVLEGYYWGHLQIVYEGLEIEVQSPTSWTEIDFNFLEVITPPYDTYGDFVYPEILAVSENTPFYGQSEDVYKEITLSLNAPSFSNYNEQRSADDVWTILSGIRGEFVSKGDDIPYGFSINSNSFANSLLWMVGIDYNLSDVQPDRVDGFPGVDNNLLLGAYAPSFNLDGTSGNDFLRTGNGDDTLDFSQGGNDIVYSGAGNDTIIGGAGNDRFYGGDGSDTLDYSGASSGIGVAINSAGGAISDGMGGTDTTGFFERIIGTNSDDTFSVQGELDDIEAASDSSTGLNLVAGDEGSVGDTIDLSGLIETGGVHVSLGGAGSIGFVTNGNIPNVFASQVALDSFENVIGTAYADTITGNSSDNVIIGESGGDTINGDDGNDTINGDAGNDSINAGDGDDTVFGGDAHDTINGDIGNDTLAGDDGNDFIEGGAGTDTIYGGSGTDNINAGIGNDIVYGGSDNDIINGGEDNDVLSGGSGSDAIDGGSGDDIVRFTGATGGISVDFTSGGNGSGTGGDASGDTYSNIEGIIGTASADTFTATTGGVVLAGGAGVDTFNITYQSSGTPYVIWGGDGADVYNLDLGDANPESTILGILGVNVTNLTEHNFHLFSLDNNALYANIPREHVDVIVLNPDNNESVAGWTFFGPQNDYPTITLPDIFGTSGNDSLTGSNANDVISSGAGNDFIKSGAGNDTIIYTSGHDTIAGFTQNYGFDTVDLRGYASADVSFRISGVDVIATTADGEITLANQVSYDVGHQRSNIEEIMLSDGTLDDAGIRARAIADQSTSGDDVIMATKYNDVISSAAGNDTITAREGNDTIIYTSGDDVIAGNKWNKGYDTLDLSNYTAMDVSFSISGDDILITTSDGVITLAQQLFNELGHLNSNIEQITFSDGTLDDAGIRNRAVADQSAGADGIVTGTAGNDNINAAFVDADSDAINDLGQTINAGSGSDLIYDGAGDDFVFGGDGNDRFYSGAGADAFDGGTGSDRVFYTGSDVGVTVDLTDASQSTGVAQGDSYTGISQIDGSSYNDIIIMDGSVQKANGGAGDDRLVDMLGSTHLWGAAGADTFELHIGSGTSNIRDFSGSGGQGDQIDLTGWNVDAIDATNFSIERRFGTTSSKYDIDAILIVTDGQGSELDRTVVNGITWDTAGNHSLTMDDFMFV